MLRMVGFELVGEWFACPGKPKTPRSMDQAALINGAAGSMTLCTSMYSIAWDVVKEFQFHWLVRQQHLPSVGSSQVHCPLDHWTALP